MKNNRNLLSTFFPILIMCTILLLATCAREEQPPAEPEQPLGSYELAQTILGNPDLAFVLDKANSILSSDLNASSSYGEVWIRDLNTFIEMALGVQDKDRIRRSLLTFFHFQGEDGNIIDGYIPAENASVGYDYIESPSQPMLKGHKNTVETDQESSLIQAVYKYIKTTGDHSILNEEINGLAVKARLLMALEFLRNHRYNDHYGLIWGATTVDWGDVQPEHIWGVELDEHSHLAIDVYDNAMFVIAINNMLELMDAATVAYEEWQQVRDSIKWNVRQHLWDEARHKFRPHIYIKDSPFPQNFDEDRIYYHGGTAVAIEACFLSRDEIGLVLNDMRNNVRFAGAATIGLTIFPAYPAGYFLNHSMRPYSYQNGGDWTWFGGRMVQQLFVNGFIEEAYTELVPMLERVREKNGFYEWYTVDNQPRGSGTFRGSAGVLGKAVRMLLEWARANSGHQ